MHLRRDGDDADRKFAAVCSCTEDQDGNAWADDAIDGHRGNGLEIRFR